MHWQIIRHWLVPGAVGAAVVLGGTAGLILHLRRRPTAAQREERRRLHLAATGRIVDGNLIDADPSEDEPSKLIYRYRVAGVTYECSQDVSALAGSVRNLRLDFPVQVRYDLANPGDSIVVAESWNGLWHPRTFRERDRPAAN